MTNPVVSSMAFVPAAPNDENDAPAKRAYRTKTSFVAVYFDQTGKGRIVFLPYRAVFNVIGPSSCLPEGFEVVFRHEHHHVFAVDVLERSTPICEPIETKRLA